VAGLHQATAALYLAAALAAALGLALPSARMGRWAVGLIGAGLGLHTVSFLTLHGADSPPQLTTLPAAVSLMVWMAVLIYLVLLLRRARVAGLVVLLAPAAFLGVFGAALGFGRDPASGLAPSASWSHVHILLASGGLGFLAVAGIAGVLYVVEHHRLKAKRSPLPVPLPSLEALDRVNRLSLGLGFLMLTLGVLTGVLWVRSASGELWPGTPHATWTLVAWAIYAVLTTSRFAARQGARESALSAALGFGFLLFAVIGVGALT
jgi:ABC-type transport system involved in cytochrome c biogenesis permease subunit